MNPFELFKNAGAIQQQLEKVQAQLAEITETGSSGGRMVEVTLNGKFEMIDIKLDPICVDNRDCKMLEDLIKAAQHDAMSKIQERIKEVSGPMLSGMNFPGM